MTATDLAARARAAFAADLEGPPPVSMRGGYAIDGYDLPEPFDPVADAPTDAYLAALTFWGMAHLDPRSWRHYVPLLVDYALRHGDDAAMATEGLLHNLRPPDRDPPRLASLTAVQCEVVREFLAVLEARHPEWVFVGDVRREFEEFADRGRGR